MKCSMCNIPARITNNIIVTFLYVGKRRGSSRLLVTMVFMCLEKHSLVPIACANAPLEDGRAKKTCSLIR
jgi:hypothetical protein